MNIAGIPALVTGGASGLGRATVELFTELGAKVALIDTQHEQAELVASKTGALCLPCDVSDEAAVAASLDRMRDVIGVPRIVVQTAGIAPPFQATVGRKGAFPVDLFRKVIEVNLTGTFNVARLAAERMRELEPLARGERGVIINVSSINSFDGPGGTVAYTASKAGVQGMTLVMARDLGRFGIRVVTIAPGSFLTPMLEGAAAQILNRLREEVPFPNDALGDPRDFARLARSVVENVMVNGETIRLDGGARLGHF